MEPEEMFKTSPANSEYVTRKELIDREMKDAGWRIVKFDAAKPLAEYNRCAIEEYPTESGPADYALCVGGRVLGVVEAKKLSVFLEHRGLPYSSCDGSRWVRPSPIYSRLCSGLISSARARIKEMCPEPQPRIRIIVEHSIGH